MTNLPVTIYAHLRLPELVLAHLLYDVNASPFYYATLPYLLLLTTYCLPLLLTNYDVQLTTYDAPLTHTYYVAIAVYCSSTHCATTLRITTLLLYFTATIDYYY